VVEPWDAATKNTVAFSIKPGLHTLVASFTDPGPAAPHLEALTAELEARREAAGLADFIDSETLPGLAKVIARRNITNALRERVRGLSEALTGAVAELRGADSDTESSGAGVSSLTAMATPNSGNALEGEDKVMRSLV